MNGEPNTPTPQRFRKKPVTIEAMRFDGTERSQAAIVTWADGQISGWFDDRYHLEIRTLEGVMRADVGDWIIRGVQGEFYPCKPKIFTQTYEPAETPAARDDAAELRAEIERLRQDRKPDYLYNPNDWEYTVPWRDRHLFDAEIGDADGVVRYRTAYDGPDVFAADIPIEFDDAGWPVRFEIQWFDSQEAAEEALLRVAAPEEQP